MRKASALADWEEGMIDALTPTVPFAEMVAELQRTQSEAVRVFANDAFERSKETPLPIDAPVAPDWYMLNMPYTTEAVLAYLSRLPDQLGALEYVGDIDTERTAPDAWRLSYMVAPEEVVRITHWTLERLRTRFEAEAPEYGQVVQEHALLNVSRWQDGQGQRWLKQRPSSVALYYALSVREANIVGATVGEYGPTTQLTVEAWLFASDAPRTDADTGFAQEPENEFGDAIPIDITEEDDTYTRELTAKAGYYHLARKAHAVPVAERDGMVTDRLLPLIDSIVRNTIEEANVRVCGIDK